MDNNINNFIKDLIEKKEGSQEFDTFIALLRGIKSNSNLLDFYGSEFIGLLAKVLINVCDKYAKALIIETIVETFYEEYCDIDINYRDELFNEYIVLLEKNSTSIEDAVRCLNGFIYSGINTIDVFIRIASRSLRLMNQ